MRPARLAAVAAAIAAGAALFAAVSQLDVVQVTGRSMWPTLRPGDRLLVTRLRRPPRVGEVVLAPDPRDPRRELVKRVAHLEGGLVTLRGDDSKRSTDARTFGAVPTSEIQWRVLARYSPLRRLAVTFTPGAHQGA